jgi:hypothetical protein
MDTVTLFFPFVGFSGGNLVVFLIAISFWRTGWLLRRQRASPPSSQVSKASCRFFDTRPMPCDWHPMAAPVPCVSVLHSAHASPGTAIFSGGGGRE